MLLQRGVWWAFSLQVTSYKTEFSQPTIHMHHCISQ